MNFICPHCKTEGQVADNLIPEYGCWHKCVNCNEGVLLKKTDTGEISKSFGREQTVRGDNSSYKQNIDDFTDKDKSTSSTDTKQAGVHLGKTADNARNNNKIMCLLKEYLEVVLFCLAFISPWQALKEWLLIAACFILIGKFLGNKYTFIKSKTAFIGYAAAGIGLAYLIAAINKDTAVGGYHNLGLMNEKTNWTIASSAVMIFGVLLIIFSKFFKPSDVSPQKTGKITSNITEELKKLVEMKNSEVLTEDEFLIAKRKLLQGD